MAKEDAKAQLIKLIELVRSAVTRDRELREEYSIGEKFRFIQDRLRVLLEGLEKKLQVLEQEEASQDKKGSADQKDVMVYVSLFNAQGVALRNWYAMLMPKVFYEYSVNRPIYQDKSHVEAFIRSRPNKVQHAYLTIAIKPSDITISAEQTAQKDAIGNPLIRVKEGSLKFEKLVSFTHNDQNYVFHDGELMKSEI